MHTFDTPSPISAVVEVPAGRIQFIAADRADSTVEVRPMDASKGRDVKAAQQTTVDYRGGVLRIQAATKNQLLGPSGSIEVAVQLLETTRLSLEEITTRVGYEDANTLRRLIERETNASPRELRRRHH